MTATGETDLLGAARGGDSGAFDALVAPLRPGLLLHCYRMLASSHDAEDAVQETLIRAWKSLDRFEGRSALRTWLFTVATNVCLREIERRGRRLRPVDLSPAGDPALGVGPPLTETVWLGPLPGAGLVWESSPVDAVYEQKESVELAFVAALQHLPALQRAVLVMRDVLAMPAAEVAVALDTSVAAANSALQRARVTMRERLPDRSQQRVLRDLGDEHVRASVAAFVAAWERADVGAVVALLADDVVMAMPPFGEWYAGRAAVADFIAAYPLRPGRRWSCRVTTANGQPAVEKYVWDEEVGAFLAHSVSVLSFAADGRILGFDAFLDPALMS
ncbi:RNA polymerase subunit sigma-70 [Nocardioides conyzicola]|uniref:Sigma-70 family RNA polymerase sigma factor n=1 Tax=Nocardioides conyzicola TaxID=1651781 RepID=A0ABP8Y3Q4_9ACTN